MIPIDSTTAVPLLFMPFFPPLISASLRTLGYYPYQEDLLLSPSNFALPQAKKEARRI